MPSAMWAAHAAHALCALTRQDSKCYCALRPTYWQPSFDTHDQGKQSAYELAAVGRYRIPAASTRPDLECVEMTSEETRLAALAGRSVCASMARLALLLLALVASALAIANGVGRLPAMGWNTWCTESLECIDDYCTEAEVMAVADGTPDPQSPGGTQ